MNRYFYYLLITNMLVNVIAFVPRILIRHRYNGTVMAIFWCAVLETLLMYLFVYSLRKFPQQGIPEILDRAVPAWLKQVLLTFFSLAWYFAGVVTMLAYTDFSRKFINPDVNYTVIIGMFLMIVILVSRQPSLKILYILEIILIISVPPILFILSKSFFNKSMDWDAVAAVAVYYNRWPTWAVIAAGSHIFSGYVNMAIFNRVFHPFKPKFLWLAPILGMTIMTTTIFIPIGFLGSDAVGDYVFAWVSTADAMRIELGFIERVMFIFIFLYGLIAFASMIFHWHVSLELLKSVLPEPNGSKRMQSRLLTCCIALFCIGALWAGSRMNDKNLFEWGEIWLKMRLPTEALLVGLTVYAARRLKA